MVGELPLTALEGAIKIFPMSHPVEPPHTPCPSKSLAVVVVFCSEAPVGKHRRACCLPEVVSDHTRFPEGLWTPSHKSAPSVSFLILYHSVQIERKRKPHRAELGGAVRARGTCLMVSGLKGPVRAKEQLSLNSLKASWVDMGFSPRPAFWWRSSFTPAVSN